MDESLEVSKCELVDSGANTLSAFLTKKFGHTVTVEHFSYAFDRCCYSVHSYKMELASVSRKPE